MFTEQLERHEALLEKRNLGQDVQRMTQLLERRHEELATLHEEWQPLAAIAAELGYADRTTLHQLRELCSRPAWTALDNNDAQTDLKEMRNLISQVKSDLTFQWSEIRQQHPSGASHSKASFLMYIGHADVKSQLQSLNHTISQVAARDLPTSAQYVQWQQHVAKLEEIVNEQLPDMGQAVEQFFNKLMVSEATLADITPEIMAWCQAHDLTHRITLRFSDRA